MKSINYKQNFVLLKCWGFVDSAADKSKYQPPGNQKLKYLCEFVSEKLKNFDHR